MGVSFHVGHMIMEIGSSSFLQSFFSTIAVRLENEQWGSRFPVLMNQLYQGRLPLQSAKEARNELKKVKREFEKLSPTDVVWDFDDREASPPWGSEIAPSIETLADYFVTSSGRNLLKVVDDAFRVGLEAGSDVEIL